MQRQAVSGRSSPSLAVAAARRRGAGRRAAHAARVGGLHDARYCEILELKGAPPDATATVWNTIGLNRARPRGGTRFDAGGAGAASWATTRVVLNGPRHFLMDSVTAAAGRVRSFHGMRMRKVATIPIRTAADLAQTPYTDRTISRANTWRWKRGRTVYELVAPGGDTYVMQSYSQIKDPTLTLAKLRALGRRLEAARPAGATARARCAPARRCGASGSATILQDELQNTYQLATTTRRPASASATR